MSEKTPLQLEEAVQSPPAHPSPNSQAKERRRARLYKAVCFYFAWVMANSMHKYALAHAREGDLTHWNELIAPVNRHLSSWFLMFSAPLAGPSRPQFLDTAAFFIAAIFSFCVYARFYYQWNQHNDEFQLHVMTTAAFFGFMVPAILCSSLTISAFTVMPKAALVGLLLSDLLHLAFKGPWQKESSKNERAVDEEMGPCSDADESEKSVCLASEDDVTDVPCTKATTQ